MLLRVTWESATLLCMKYAESLLEKIYACKNNLENLFTIKVSKHTTCGNSIFAQYEINLKNLMDVIKNTSGSGSIVLTSLKDKEDDHILTK